MRAECCRTITLLWVLGRTSRLGTHQLVTYLHCTVRVVTPAHQLDCVTGLWGTTPSGVCVPCRQCLLNVVADSTTGLLGFAMLVRDTEGRGQLFRTAGRIFGGFSDTAKAFIIIASTDILLGCAAR